MRLTFTGCPPRSFSLVPCYLGWNCLYGAALFDHPVVKGQPEQKSDPEAKDRPLETGASTQARHRQSCWSRLGSADPEALLVMKESAQVMSPFTGA